MAKKILRCPEAEVPVFRTEMRLQEEGMMEVKGGNLRGCWNMQSIVVLPQEAWGCRQMGLNERGKGLLLLQTALVK